MASYSTSEFKNGLKVMIDGAPHSILGCDFVKPGKGQAFVRLKVRQLLTGRVNEKTYKSGEQLDAADVMEMEMQYLYSDNMFWHFMNLNTYEQIAANADAVGEAKLWLKVQTMVTTTLWNQEVIAVMPPNFVILKITETDPGLKGDTTQGGSKSATLESGAVVRVPLFIQEGELIKIDTRTGEYVSRAKSY